MATALDGARFIMILAKILAIVLVIGLIGGLFYLGGRIPPNNSGGGDG